MASLRLFKISIRGLKHDAVSYIQVPNVGETIDLETADMDRHGQC